MIRRCPRCSNNLEKTGITSTRHDILSCPACLTEYVAWLDRLEPITAHHDLTPIFTHPEARY